VPDPDAVTPAADASSSSDAASEGRFARFLGGQPREVWVLSAVAFAVALGFGIVAPAIVLFAKSFGVSDFLAGTVISVFALMRFASAPAAGWLVNRTGERIILATGIAIVAVSSLVAGLSQDIGQLIVLRGAGGVGSAMFTVSAAALLLRVVEPQQRARATGAFQAGFLVGGITGPLFGGILTAISLRLPFFVYAATLILAGVIGLVFLSGSRLRQREERAGTLEPPTPLGVALRSRAYLAATFNNFATGWGLFGLRMSLLPLFVVEGLGLGAGWVGLGLFVSTITQGVTLAFAGRLADVRGRRPALTLGASLVCLSFVVLATLQQPPFYLLAMATFGMGSAFLGTSSTAVVGDVIGGRGGTAISTFQMASDLGAFLGPLAAGAISDATSFATAFAVTAVVAAIGATLAGTMPETLRRTESRAAA
jgi:MFS transporter, DHA1 family, multidrug resistance protein